MTPSSAIVRRGALPPVVVASHPRSGTHLVMDVLRRQFASFDTWRMWGLPLDYLYLNLERLGAAQRQFSETRARRIVNRPKRALLKTHFQAHFASGWSEDEQTPPPQDWQDLVRGAIVIYVVRHPLDVMSSYFQFLCGIDERVAEKSFFDFLQEDHWDKSTSRLGWWCSHVSGWSNLATAHVVRYEDIVKTPNDAVERFATILNEEPRQRSPILPPKIETINRTRFDRMFSLSPSSTGIVANKSRFKAPDWRTVLSRGELDWVLKTGKPLVESLSYEI